MKPPVRPSHDPRPALWATGAIFTVAGVAIMLFDNPLVPITHVFGLLPLSVGGAVGAALLRERYGPYVVAAYVLLMLYVVWQTFATQTTGGLVFLTAGVFSLSRAVIRSIED